jgi:hypothetical protein
MSQQIQRPQDQSTETINTKEETMDSKTTDATAQISDIDTKEETMDIRTTSKTHEPTATDTTVKDITQDKAEIETSKIPDVDVITAFDRLKPELDLIAESDLITKRLGTNRAMQRGMSLAQVALDDRSMFIAVYKNPPLKEIDSLKDRAMAVKGAEIGDEDGVSEPPDLDRARELRTEHTLVLKAVFRKAPAVLEQLEALPMGKAYENLGTACLMLAAIERKHWDKINQKKMLTTEEAVELGQLGMRILKWEQHRGSDQDRPYTRRALTYLDQAYTKVRLYARVVYEGRRDEWRERYPALYTFTVSPRKDRGKNGQQSDPQESPVVPEELEPITPPADPS